MHCCGGLLLYVKIYITVEYIALTRTKDFVAGIDADGVDDSIRKLLLPNDVIEERGQARLVS